MDRLLGRWRSAGRRVGLARRRRSLPAPPASTQGFEPLEPRLLLSGIVINEIHYDPDVKTEPAEFIELFNDGPAAVDLSGWAFTDGVDFTFAPGTVLAAGGYVVVAHDPATVAAKYGATALGPWVGKLSNGGETIVLSDASGAVQDEVDYQLGFPWPTVGDAPGYSIELINPSLANDLGGNWRGSVGPGGVHGPTPGAPNSVLAANAAPQMRQVNHSPNEPHSNEDVGVTVKVTDPDGVAAVTLEYQLVDAGDYIDIDDPRFASQWTALAMHDDGAGGDALGGDDVYTAVLPAALQVHRRLVRYRITAQDALGASITGPYADDPQPNFAYYVYDAVPAWTGADQPGVTPDVAYPADLLDTLPVYQLITTRKSHEDAQFIPDSTRGGGYGGEEYLWVGTLVYDGQVYDHIHFRARGGVWRFAMGKNMWKFDFNRGHGFQARDNYGNKYDTQWDKVNFSAIIQQGNYLHRGEQGLFESVGFKLFNLAGVEGPNTTFVEFRVVDHADENGADQFSGDFQGLYLAVEQPDGAMLDEHGLPDGNLYKMEGGTGTLNNQGPTQPSDKSDLNAFLNTYTSTTPSTQWWRDNLDLQGYYSYRAILEGIHHYDTGYGKNYFYYHDPETDMWSVHPWDLDLTWADNMYGNGAEPFRDRVLPIPELGIEYRNRMRELRDLLYNGEQAGMVIDEMASFIYTPDRADGLSLVDADRAMWDYNPILASGYVNPSKAGNGRYYQSSATGDFAGMMQLMKDYIASRGAWIDSQILTDEAQVPATPVASYAGPAEFPVNTLAFNTTALAGGSGQFAAAQWRIAEVTDPVAPGFDPAKPRKYEIDAAWESGELTTFAPQATIPGAGLDPGDTYRVRVRLKDSAGRWSHWSDPVQFIAGDPTGPQVQSLRITELMYHPADTPGDPGSGEAFEFVELYNIGAEAFNLQGVSFTAGIDYTFGDEALAPGETIVLAADPAAFAMRYTDPGIRVVGPYTGSFSNGGEHVTLVDAGGGVVLDFTYHDDWYPLTDGGGYSLVIADAAAPPQAWDSKDGWRASELADGNPGGADGGLDAGAIVVNELLTHTDTAPGDRIELLNTTAAPIDVGGWFLSDDAALLTKYRIADNTVIAPGGFAVFDEQSSFGIGSGDPGSNVGFGLSELGETLYVSGATASGELTSFRIERDFGAADRDVSFARHVNSDGDVDFVAASAATFGAANAPPRVPPVVINEVMYHPASEDNGDEFIELFNRRAVAVDLFDPLNPANTWAFFDGVEFTFPQGVTLGPGEYLLVVGTDPSTFAAAHSVPPGVAVFGPWTGNLANDGEAISLYKPGEPELDGFVPMIQTERVRYRDSVPWPASADGLGSSLSRLDPAAYGNEPTNWGAGTLAGTPGQANRFIDGTPPTVPGDVAAQVVSSTRIDLSWSASVDGESGVAMYQIYRNGGLIDTIAAPAPGYSDTTALTGAPYAYEVSAVNGDDLASDRSAAVDVSIMSLASVVSTGPTQVVVTFGQPVEQISAETASYYTIDNASVLAATLTGDGRTVVLSISPLTLGAVHTLTVDAVTGPGGGQLPPGTQATFAYPDAVELWLALDDGAGDTAIDESGHGRDATLVGPAWTTGELGGALDFNGSSDRLDTGVDLSQWLGGTASLAFWIRTTQSGGSSPWLSPGVTGIEEAGGGNDVFWGWIDGAGHIAITAGNGAGAASDNPINDGQWRHVALTRDAASGQVKLYVNGVLNDAAVGETGLKTNAFASFGRIDDTGGTPVYFAGTLDEVRVYSRLLTDSEIALMADATPPHVTAVRLGGQAWTAAFIQHLQMTGQGAGGYAVPTGGGEQLLALPWTDVNQLSVTFDEPVVVAPDNLTLAGVNAADYALGELAYDPATRTATWTLAAPLPADKFMLRLSDSVSDPSGNALDGQWTNPAAAQDPTGSAFPSGDGAPGGDFMFRFNVLPGDAVRDGAVDVYDAIRTRNHQFTAAGDAGYGAFYDVNGDGVISLADTLAVHARQFGALPTGEPTGTAVASAAGASDGELRAALSELTRGGTGESLTFGPFTAIAGDVRYSWFDTDGD